MLYFIFDKPKVLLSSRFHGPSDLSAAKKKTDITNSHKIQIMIANFDGLEWVGDLFAPMKL